VPESTSPGATGRAALPAHSPRPLRVNGAAFIHDGFHGAFGTEPGDGVFNSDDQRTRVW